MTMKRFLVYILLLLPCTLLHAQTVTNVDARQDGQNIVITFNMDKPTDVTLYYSTSGRYGSYKLIENRYLTKQRISSTEYCYIWNVTGQCGEFSFNNVVFRVEAEEETTKSNSFFLSLGGFYSLNNDFGATFRLGYNAMYVSVKTNFKTEKYYESPINTTTDYFMDGSEAVNRWSILLGVNWFWRNRVSFYTGAGIGERVFSAIPCNEQNRVLIDKNSANGLELECGLNLRITEDFGVTAGYSVLDFKYSEFMGGIFFRW